MLTEQERTFDFLVRITVSDSAKAAAIILRSDKPEVEMAAALAKAIVGVATEVDEVSVVPVTTA